MLAKAGDLLVGHEGAHAFVVKGHNARVEAEGEGLQAHPAHGEGDGPRGASRPWGTGAGEAARVVGLGRAAGLLAHLFKVRQRRMNSAIAPRRFTRR
ncbi:MAG: hypothetical protein K8R59_00290 [Thermoanaerobaculales bacterium]|nr:hypothetical protein [Thermoanaerobaculales bacterium]